MNDLSEPLDGVRYFADSLILYQKATTTMGRRSICALRARPPSATASSPQSIAGVDITGTLKFTRYFTNAQSDAGHPIPIIKNEELILLRAEARYLRATIEQARLSDLNFVRVNSGGLRAVSGTRSPTTAAFINALLYEREFSLAVGARHDVDRRAAVQPTEYDPARRYERSVPTSHADSVRGVPRALGGNCSPLGK